MDCAVIYAAGRATRLGPAFAKSPKILLPVAGRSLLDRHAENLARIGIQRLIVVTGHCREQIADLLPGLHDKYGLQTYEIHNPNYMEGSVISMHFSLPVLESMQKPVLLMDGDVLYDAELLQRLGQSRFPSAMLLDFGVQALDDDPVMVPIRNGQPVEFMKKWTGEADRVAESVGFFKIAPQHLPRLVSETRKRTVGLSRRDSIDDVFRAMVIAGLIGFEDVSGLPWTEIDFPHDVEYATRVVLPGIEQRAGCVPR